MDLNYYLQSFFNLGSQSRRERRGCAGLLAGIFGKRRLDRWAVGRRSFAIPAEGLGRAVGGWGADWVALAVVGSLRRVEAKWLADYIDRRGAGW